MGGPVDLLQQVDDLGSLEWSGTAFRHTAPSRDPLSGAGALLFGGRWNPPDLVSTLYLASPEAACIAEFERMAHGQGRGVDSFLPRDVHELRVTRVNVLDLTSPDALAAVGLSMQEIESDDWLRCQEVGKTAHYLMLQGVLAPSATGSGFVLAAFEPRLRPGQLEVISTHTMRQT